MDYQPNDYGFSPQNDQPLRQKTSGKAIAALVLGLAGVVPYVGFVTSILAIIYSILAFRDIKRTGAKGRGMAVTGLIFAILFLILYIIGIITMIYVLSNYDTLQDFLDTIKENAESN
ncbi:DUF4190 domain-containing protein [Paenibacillus kobensis]|uniref:DUF4190 domain-containing protein n=1 Tax=Paenibacillus kobensis TaxID=59841 RepID=UPI0013E34BE9|nr:DUF4190 domain-containing protein [Paenibacillus kobensis]